MLTSTQVLQRLRRGEACETRDLEAALVAMIETGSGARRTPPPERPAIVVQPIPLDPPLAIESSINSSVRWIARRIKDAGAMGFHLSVTRHPNRLVVVAQWPRSASSSGGD